MQDDTQNGIKRVRFDRTGGTGVIVLGDPPDNQLGRAFADELLLAVHEASASDVRALVIRAEGPNFGTGGDVPEWPGKHESWFRTFIAEVNQAYAAIEALRIPVVAAVRGQVVSGHYELVLRADLVLAAESASFTWVEPSSAMTPLAGGAQRLAERIGRSRAASHILLAQTISATEAEGLGLAHRVVPDAQLDEAALALGEQLATGATRAHAATKALFKAWSAGGVAGADALMLDLSMDLFTTIDAQQAFAEITRAAATGKHYTAPTFIGR